MSSRNTYCREPDALRDTVQSSVTHSVVLKGTELLQADVSTVTANDQR